MMQNPRVQLFRVSHDRTAWTVVYTLDRQPLSFPTLHRAYAIPEMFGNLFPTRQNHSERILAQPGTWLWHTMFMPSEEEAHDQKARRKFSQQATESLQRHSDDLAQSKEIASDAALDLKQRKKYRHKRVDAVRVQKKATP